MRGYQNLKVAILMSDSEIVDLVSKEFNIKWNDACNLREIEELFEDGYFIYIDKDTQEILVKNHGEKVGFVLHKVFDLNPEHEVIGLYFDN